eukprot:3941272-Rhodomonas_salina.2
MDEDRFATSQKALTWNQGHNSARLLQHIPRTAVALVLAIAAHGYAQCPGSSNRHQTGHHLLGNEQRSHRDVQTENAIKICGFVKALSNHRNYLSGCSSLAT